ncbi:unnamed protein product [Camellia sinensis]
MRLKQLATILACYAATNVSFPKTQTKLKATNKLSKKKIQRSRESELSAENHNGALPPYNSSCKYKATNKIYQSGSFVELIFLNN